MAYFQNATVLGGSSRVRIVERPRRWWVETAYAIFDFVVFLYRWLLSAIHFGTVIVINNRSDEVLGLELWATDVGPRGYGDHTWRDRGRREVIPSKIPLWTIPPRRRRSFMLPFSTSLMVLGTEANYKCDLINSMTPDVYEKLLLYKFVALWSTRHSFLPKWAEIRPNLSVNTSLKVGECRNGYGYLNRALTDLPRFEIRVDLNKCPRLVLPVGSPVSIGESVWNPDGPLERHLTFSSAFGQHGYGLTTINMLRDILNEVSALVEVIRAVDLFRKIFASYLFWMILVWNSLKDQINPSCQYAQYGSDGFRLTTEHGFDCTLAALCLALPGGLQAILVLIISHPDSGLQLLSVVLAFGNLAFFASALAMRFAHLIPTKWIFWYNTERARFLVKEALSFAFVGIPVYGAVALGYYYNPNTEATDIIKYCIAGILMLGFYCYFVFYIFDLDVGMKGITPLMVIKLLGVQAKLIVMIFNKENLNMVVEKLIKYMTECLICILVLVSLAINAYVVFGVKQ